MSETIPPTHALARVDSVSVADVRRGLLPALLATLERRHLDGLQVSTAPLLPAPLDDVRDETRFLQVYEVAHGQDLAQSLHLYNMQNVIGALRDGSHSLIYSVGSDGRAVRLMLGVRSLLDTHAALETRSHVEVLQRALRSNYPGIVLSPDPGETYRVAPYDEWKRDLLDPLRTGRHLACLTGIPSLRDPSAPQHFSFQSIDRLVDALRGEAYTLLVLAEPVGEARLVEMIARLRLLSQEVHSLVRRSVTESQNLAGTKGSSQIEGTTFQLGAGQIIAAIFGISFGQSWSRTESEQVTETSGLAAMQESLDKTAEFCEQLLDHHVARLQTGRSLGFWKVGVYLASDDPRTSLRAQGVLRSLYAGQHTCFEPLRITDLSNAPAEVRKTLLLLHNPSLRYLTNPQVDPQAHFDHPLGGEHLSLGTLLTSEELSLLVSFPSREVPGLRLKPVVDFNLNPPSRGDLDLGSVLYRGEVLLSHPLRLSLDALTRHTFVSGLTGSGKTNTCMVLLRSAGARGVPFLVIEPARTEYRSFLADVDHPVQIFTLGDETSPFRLNPFEFEPGFNLLTHIDLLKSVFNAVFPMYASMPHLLEEAIMAVYRERGWDVVRSTNRHFLKDPAADRRDYLPTLADLHAQVESVVKNAGYDERLTHDLTAALKTRINSLRQGGKGRMLDTQRSLSFAALLSTPTVLELQEIGDDDEKAFVMALLLMRLYEHCRVQRREASGRLRHLTLIEEAHRLLKNVPVSLSAEAANARGKTVEMFTDILAEIRGYGEGFIIVDQVPSKLTPDVVKNTNLKIAHRLVAQDDRDFVGSAMGLRRDQNEHLVRLEVGQAVVHSEETYTPALIKVHPSHKDDLKAELLRDEQGLVQRSTEATRSRQGEDYRRWEICFDCAEPCRFLSAENTPAPADLPPFQRFFDAVLYSDLPMVRAKWQALLEAACDRLSENYPEAEWQIERDGLLHCFLAQQVRAGAGVYQSYYRFHARGGHRALVQLEREVMGLARLLLDEAPQAEIESAASQARQVFLSQMATAPANSRTGCSLCQKSCAFGILVQTHPQMSPQARPHLSQAFTKEVGEAGENSPLRGSLGRLQGSVEAAQAFAGKAVQRVVQMRPQDLPHLGYCFLAHFTSDLDVLQAYQRSIVNDENGLE